MTDTFGETAIETARFYFELGNYLLLKIENSQEILAPQQDQAAEVKNIMKEAMGKMFETATAEVTPSKEEKKEEQPVPAETKEQLPQEEVKKPVEYEEVVTTSKKDDEP